MAEPLSQLSPSKQNIKTSPHKIETRKAPNEYDPNEVKPAVKMSTNSTHPSSSEDDEFHDTLSNAPSSPMVSSPHRGLGMTNSSSPGKMQSPRKNWALEGVRLSPTKSQSPLKEPTLRFNEEDAIGIGHIEQNLEMEDSVLHHDIANESETTIYLDGNGIGGAQAEAVEESEITLSLDDTMGDLSTFSAVTNADMTRFANLRTSPVKSYGGVDWSPSKQLRNSVSGTPGTIKRPLHLVSERNNDAEDDADATPRRPYSLDSPTDLLNFTGQSNIIIPPPGSAPRTSRRSPSGRGAFPIRVNPSPTHRSQASIDRERSRGTVSPTRQSYFPPSVLATPADERRRPNNLADLLDIDLEPMATPRSIPTVTPRELETLRSEMQSQISGLSATLSGKEAEVLALKRAITDAEVRVGNTSEELRNERSAREGLEEERTEWERHRREMENVLREARQNIMICERDSEKTRKQGEDAEKRAEKRAEEQEVRILELEAMLESSRKQNNSSPTRNGGDARTAGLSSEIDAAVKDATERVARELHSLYKGKHETKVEALKKSYAARWEKQARELQESLRSAKDEIVKMQTDKDATMSGIVPGQAQKIDDLAKEKDAVAAERQMLRARVAGLEEETAAMRSDNESLRIDLERERVEKGDLVSQVDLFLTMDAEIRTAVSNINGHAVVNANANSSEGLSSPSPGLKSSLNGGGRPRPMSMLKQPAKSFTSIPTPGESKVSKASAGRAVPPRGGIMEGIARMGAGGRG